MATDGMMWNLAYSARLNFRMRRNEENWRRATAKKLLMDLERRGNSSDLGWSNSGTALSMIARAAVNAQLSASILFGKVTFSLMKQCAKLRTHSLLAPLSVCRETHASGIQV
jgi:hypothetical protein